MASKNSRTYEISEEAEKLLKHVAIDYDVTTGHALSEAISLLALIYRENKQGRTVVVLNEQGTPINEVTIEL